MKIVQKKVWQKAITLNKSSKTHVVVYPLLDISAVNLLPHAVDSLISAFNFKQITLLKTLNIIDSYLEFKFNGSKRKPKKENFCIVKITLNPYSLEIKIVDQFELDGVVIGYHTQSYHEEEQGYYTTLRSETGSAKPWEFLIMLQSLKKMIQFLESNSDFKQINPIIEYNVHPQLLPKSMTPKQFFIELANLEAQYAFFGLAFRLSEAKKKQFFEYRNNEFKLRLEPNNDSLIATEPPTFDHNKINDFICQHTDEFFNKSYLEKQMTKQGIDLETVKLLKNALKKAVDVYDGFDNSIFTLPVLTNKSSLFNPNGVFKDFTMIEIATILVHLKIYMNSILQHVLCLEPQLVNDLFIEIDEQPAEDDLNIHALFEKYSNQSNNIQEQTKELFRNIYFIEETAIGDNQLNASISARVLFSEITFMNFINMYFIVVLRALLENKEFALFIQSNSNSLYRQMKFTVDSGLLVMGRIFKFSRENQHNQEDSKMIHILKKTSGMPADISPIVTKDDNIFIKNTLRGFFCFTIYRKDCHDCVKFNLENLKGALSDLNKNLLLTAVDDDINKKRKIKQDPFETKDRDFFYYMIEVNNFVVLLHDTINEEKKRLFKHNQIEQVGGFREKLKRQQQFFKKVLETIINAQDLTDIMNETTQKKQQQTIMDELNDCGYRFDNSEQQKNDILVKLMLQTKLHAIRHVAKNSLVIFDDIYSALNEYTKI